MYTIEIKPSGKILLLTMNGLVTEDDGKRLITELYEKIRTIKTTEYYLITDVQGLKASSHDSLDLILQSMAIMISTHFRGRCCILPKSAVTASEAIRSGKNIHDFSSIIQFDSF